jgi:cell division protein FtsB
MKILYALRHRATEEPARAPRADTEQEHRLETLRARIDHLEMVVQDLQDSTHRQFVAHDKRLDDLGTKTEPHRLAQALSRDARSHGTS